MKFMILQIHLKNATQIHLAFLEIYAKKKKKYTIYFMKNGLERKMFYKKYLSVEL